MADHCILKGRLCLLGHVDVPFIWIDCAGLCFSQSSQELQHSFDIVLRKLESVCFQREEGKEYVRLLKFLLLGSCISIGFGTDRDLPDGDLFSMCVRFCFGLT